MDIHAAAATGVIYSVGNSWEVRTTHSKEEWWDVSRALRPDLTWEEFETEWDEFLAAVVRRQIN